MSLEGLGRIDEYDEEEDDNAFEKDQKSGVYVIEYYFGDALHFVNAFAIADVQAEVLFLRDHVDAFFKPA